MSGIVEGHTGGVSDQRLCDAHGSGAAAHPGMRGRTHPAVVPDNAPHGERRQTAMPHKRSTPPPRPVRVVRRGTPPAWRVLLQRALQARQAGEWQEVGRLLTRLATAPDVPPTDPPSRDVQAWGTLQAAYWEHVAQDWQEWAHTAEAA